MDGPVPCVCVYVGGAGPAGKPPLRLSPSGDLVVRRAVSILALSPPFLSKPAGLPSDRSAEPWLGRLFLPLPPAAAFFFSAPAVQRARFPPLARRLGETARAPQARAAFVHHRWSEWEQRRRFCTVPGSIALGRDPELEPKCLHRGRRFGDMKIKDAKKPCKLPFTLPSPFLSFWVFLVTTASWLLLLS